MLATLIFVGVAEDRRTTFVDLGAETVDPNEHARGLLDAHRSCDQVEVWRDDNCIAVVERANRGPAT